MRPILVPAGKVPYEHPHSSSPPCHDREALASEFLHRGCGIGGADDARSKPRQSRTPRAGLLRNRLRNTPDERRFGPSARRLTLGRRL